MHAFISLSCGSPLALLPGADLLIIPFSFSMVLFSIAGSVALVRWVSWVFHPARLKSQLWPAGKLGAASQEERLKALEAYRQLASEKLDVIKTAVTMGYSQQELA